MGAAALLLLPFTVRWEKTLETVPEGAQVCTDNILVIGFFCGKLFAQQRKQREKASGEPFIIFTKRIILS